jgi:hypothetical protein
MQGRNDTNRRNFFQRFCTLFPVGEYRNHGLIRGVTKPHKAGYEEMKRPDDPIYRPARF